MIGGRTDAAAYVLGLCCLAGLGVIVVLGEGRINMAKTISARSLHIPILVDWHAGERPGAAANHGRARGLERHGCAAMEPSKTPADGRKPEAHDQREGAC